MIGSKGCKVLYLAPFRSLAFEIEQSLSKIFEPLGFGVSQLYGGSTLNKADIELFRENQIIIATPEKSKAMIRADSEIFSQIEFIVVDEGHLIGKDHRNIKNEMFLTHIREIAKVNDKRILLLSAVLPNAHEIAEWVAGDETAVSKSSWKPSSERFGLLKWDGKRVRLDWLSGERPFNPNFVESAPLGFGRRRNPFPNTKNEAVAATAVRMSESGPVMIFSARANSINGLAKNVLLAMGQFVEDYDWDENLWSILEHTCEEELEQEDIIVNAARKGIICHSNRLTPNVRIALEHLMRSKSPKIIIASSTLAQGVNIGISTIIVSTPFFSDEPISSRDFWNICGRAGRAFSDSEGKILYAIDMTQEQWRVRRNLNLARNYYKENQMQNVQSGLNYALYRIYEISLVEDISFELLIEKLANDTFISDLSNQDTRSEVCELFDLLDDELLSMNHDFQEREDDVSWIDSIFCDSLAFIQAAEDEIVVYTEILKGRTLGLLRRTREIKDREIIVSTGLPFSVAEKMIKDIGYFREAASVAIQNGIIEESDVEISATLLKKVENWAYNFAPNLFERSYAVDHLDDIRVGWLQGVPINELREINQDINDIVKDYYGYTIPWILHATSQIFHSDDKVLSELYSKIAILAELGLPNSDAINVYLCGVKSRRAAIEIGSLDIFKMKSIFQVKKLLSEYSFIESDLSMESKEWIEIFHKSHLKKEIISIDFPNFTTPKWEITEDIIVRVVRDKVYLSTIDGYHFINVQNTEKLPFYEIANIPGLYFTNRSGVWYLKSYSKNYSV